MFIFDACSTRRGSKGIRFDKKYLVFGDKSPEGTHFQANIQRILQYTLEGMLVVSDVSTRVIIAASVMKMLRHVFFRNWEQKI